jgi:hypothetical protein
MTYQALFERLLPSVEGTDYAAYLRSRYFLDAQAADFPDAA